MTPTNRTGVRRGIHYTWAYMLLGQIVAISFATNLFLLTLLFSPAPPVAKPAAGSQRWIGPWLLNLFSIFATAYPAMQLADEHYWYHPTHFMPMLMAPHVALMLLPVARALVPARYLSEDVHFTDKAYDYMWALVVGNAALMLAWTSATVYNYSGLSGIQTALFEHPAVSSVGFDVIFCWLTWASWFLTQSGLAQDTSSTKREHAVDGTGVALNASGRDLSAKRH